MVEMLKKFAPALLIALALAVTATAQEVEVDRYAITARIDLAANAIDIRTNVSISNLGQSAKTRLFFRLTKLSKVTSVTVNGAPAQFDASEDRRVTTLNQIAVSSSASVEAGAKATVDFNYRIEVTDSTALASIYAGEVFLLPDLVWVPMPSTMYTLYGATNAPFTLTVTAPQVSGFRPVSAGTLKAEGQNFTFEQSLNSFPFLVAGAYDQPTAFDHSGIKVEIYQQPGVGAGAENSSGASAAALLGDETRRMIDYYTKTLGPLPAGQTFKVISSARAASIAVPGAIILSEQVMRLDTLDALTIERLADAVARMWTDGRVRFRGQEARQAQPDRQAQKARSVALLRDSLPRYLAALYFEERFGKDSARELFSRMRWSYTPIAQSARDAELGIQTILQPTYTSAAFSKGPLVLRMLAETAGRDKFIGAVKSLLSGSQTRIVTNAEFLQALKTAAPATERLFQQWVESIVEPNLIIGVPIQSDKPDSQRVNLRNLGTGDIIVPVLVITESGKQLTITATIPSEDITAVEIPTAEKIRSVEIDPEKLIIQADYDNDAKPVQLSAQTLFNESIAAFNKGEFAEAETKLREAVRVAPHNSTLRAWLARALAAQNKSDEAMKEAEAATKIIPPTGGALAWAHITMGQILMARNSAAEAVKLLRKAAIEADEAPALFAANEALVKAERAASLSPPVEESIRAFITQLDSLIRQPDSERLFSIVVRQNLKKFVQGLTVSPPTSWTTEILRADRIDANRVSLDVALKIKTQDGEPSGTALFILYRTGSGWILEDVQRFNVK